MKKFDVAYFGASCDPIERNREFAEKLSLNFPLLSDPDQQVAKAYGIDRGQFSRRVTIGVHPDGRIAFIESKVDVGEAGKQLVERLKKLAVPLRDDPSS